MSSEYKSEEDRRYVQMDMFVCFFKGNLPNLVKDLNLQIQRAEYTPKKLNLKKSMPNTFNRTQLLTVYNKFILNRTKKVV